MLVVTKHSLFTHQFRPS